MSFLITFFCFFCYPTLILPEGDHDKLKKIREKKKTPKSRAITFWRACCGLVATLGARGFPCAVSGFCPVRPAANEAPRRTREKSSGTQGNYFGGA